MQGGPEGSHPILFLLRLLRLHPQDAAVSHRALMMTADATDQPVSMGRMVMRDFLPVGIPGQLYSATHISKDTTPDRMGGARVSIEMPVIVSKCQEEDPEIHPWGMRTWKPRGAERASSHRLFEV